MTTKQEIRKRIWTTLDRNGLGRFPFPLEGRIPNVEGAEQAARRCENLEVFQQSESIKVNPDAPQKPVRLDVLEAGKTLLVPTPRLRGGFYELRRDELTVEDYSRTVTLNGMKKYSNTAPLNTLSSIDLIVCGSVAVSEEGGRIGKGEGYSDLEYAIMKELGGSDVPVVTTVHEQQIVDPFPIEEHDIALDYIVTPERVIETNTEYGKPDGIDWSLLSNEDLEEMPVLNTLKNNEF